MPDKTARTLQGGRECPFEWSVPLAPIRVVVTVIAPSSEPSEGVVREIQDRLPIDPQESLRLVEEYISTRPGLPPKAIGRLHLLAAAALIRLGRLDEVERRLSIAEQKIDI